MKLFGNNVQKKVRAYYKSQDTLPKLIEDDPDIASQKLSNYFVNLQILQSGSGERSSSNVEVSTMFSGKTMGTDASRILVIGEPGVGKTTLMHYISWMWGEERLWKDKFDCVIRVRMKDLLNEDWVKGKYDLTKYPLASFVHSSLQDPKLKAEIKVTDLDKWMKAKAGKRTLLLMDGLDEVASLVEQGGIAKQILDEVLSFPNLVMTSRPNGVSADVKSKFGVVLQNLGLDDLGMNLYIKNYFKGRDAGAQKIVQDFLDQNPGVRDMCKIPINLALVCLVSEDPGVQTKLSAGFGLNSLYEEVVVYLGKKYLQKHDKKQDLVNITPDEIFNLEVMKFLKDLAFQSFAQEKLVIDPKLIRTEIQKHPGLTIEDIQQFGILIAEGEGRKIVNKNHVFVHLTFQEYLQARSLMEGLISDPERTAEFIAAHRHDARYLMTWKFLAGMVTEQEQILVTRFWEAMTCNIGESIDTDIVSSVKLFIHLIMQAKRKGPATDEIEFDARIPNLEKILKLIDTQIEKDIGLYVPDIGASGYRLDGFVERWLKETKSGNNEITGAAQDALVKIAAYCNARMIDMLLLSANDPRISALYSLSEKVPDGFERVLIMKGALGPLLKPLIESKDIQDPGLAAQILGQFVEKMPALAKEAFALLLTIYYDSTEDYGHRKLHAFIALEKVFRQFSREDIHLLQPLLKDSEEDLRTLVKTRIDEIKRGINLGPQVKAEDPEVPAALPNEKLIKSREILSKSTTAVLDSEDLSFLAESLQGGARMKYRSGDDYITFEGEKYKFATVQSAYKLVQTLSELGAFSTLPFFANSGSGMRVAASETLNPRSIADAKIKIGMQGMRVSLIDYKGNQILLLEFRDIFGRYHAWKIMDSSAPIEFVKHPSDLVDPASRDKIIKEIFGVTNSKTSKIDYLVSTAAVSSSEDVDKLINKLHESDDDIIIASFLREACVSLRFMEPKNYKIELLRDQTEYGRKMSSAISAMISTQLDSKLKVAVKTEVTAQMKSIISVFEAQTKDIESIMQREAAKSEAQAQIKLIELDPYMASFYREMCIGLNGVYAAVLSINSGMVANDKHGSVGVAAQVLDQASGMIPMFGSAVHFVAAALQALDSYNQTQAMLKYLQISRDPTDMAILSEMLARKLALAGVSRNESENKGFIKKAKELKSKLQEKVREKVFGERTEEEVLKSEGKKLAQEMVKFITSKIFSGKIEFEGFDIEPKVEQLFEILMKDSSFQIQQPTTSSHMSISNSNSLDTLMGFEDNSISPFFGFSGEQVEIFATE